MPNWVIEGALATSPRPGYRPGPDLAVPRAAVDRWIGECRTFGVESILCLLGPDQLPLYRALPEGLLAYYREAGFRVGHLPALDGLARPYDPADFERAWAFYQQLPGPLLVHCSAGMDRTGRVIRHIVSRLEANGALLDR
jgi:hypothetical protein